MVLLIVSSLTACNKLLDVKPKDVLVEENMYRNVFDADAAIIGLYGKFLNLAERYVILNELRADLLTTTTNANEYFRQLNEHNVQADNPYANPRPFYEVILNCNDLLYNMKVMLQDKKLKVEEYNMRTADVTALRSWVYLQLGIQYGKVPYITNPLSNTAEIDQLLSENGVSNLATLPRIGLSQILDSCIKAMEALAFIQPYPTGSSLVTTVDGYNTGKFFINKQVMLGQLYLWKGEYRKAAMQFKNVMETGTGQLYNNRLSGVSKGDQNDLAVAYYRYREEDEMMLVDNNNQGWRSIFSRNQDRLFDYEWIWYLPFDKSFKPENPFINLFSNRGGSYLVKPSQAAMSGWNKQVQKNDFPYDARGKKFTYRELNGQPVIMKYLYNYLDASGFMPINLLEKSGKWFLYRSASLHLQFAEAANRDNQNYLAFTLLNQGLTTIPNRITRDGYPYDFDARKTDNPTYTGDWSQNVGIRGRAYLKTDTIAAGADSTIAIENNIINEAGLELAYEGQRWSDLVRIALRRNDPNFLANKIYDKLKLEVGDAKAKEVQNRLKDVNNWYLPFK